MGLDEAIRWGLHQFTCWGVLTTDASLRITGWNHWLETHSGRRADDVLGQNLLEVFPELATRRLDRFYRQVLNGQVVLLSQRLHKYLLRMPPAKTETHLPEMRQSVRLAPLVDGDQVVGTLTLIEDVTQRVTYEEELGASARQQAALALLSQRALAGGELPDLLQKGATLAAETLGVEYGEVAEFLADGSGIVARASFGIPGEAASASRDAGPTSLAALLRRSGGPVAFSDLSHEARFSPTALQERGVVSGLAVSISVRGGAFGTLAVYSTSRRDFSADIRQFLQALANVLALAIDRKRLENDLHLRAEALQLADRRKDEFLAMLGHELRNPLAPIRNATAVLRFKCPPDHDLTWARDVIERQVQQMTRLIDDLLDISRITRGKINCHKEPIELAAVVARAVETSRPLLDSRRHQFTLTLPAEPLRLEADAARLAQVLSNLLNNAAKYTPDGGHIQLTAAREANEIVIRVADTGVGIPADMLPSIFDLFTQVGRSLDRSEGGLGIGLTLVRSLVALHGGRVETFSAGPGQGSEFVVRLPALPPDAHAREFSGAARPDRPVMAAARRILVVDDNKDSADSLALLLQLSGHTVQTAHDGPAGLQAAQTFAPEVILLDIGLPGLSGVEVASRIRNDARLRHVYIIAMTGYGQEEDRQRSHDAGFNAHLVKPIDLEQLQAMLSTGP